MLKLFHSNYKEVDFHNLVYACDVALEMLDDLELHDSNVYRDFERLRRYAHGQSSQILNKLSKKRKQ